MINLEVTLLAWNELKQHIISNDRTEAAEDFVRVLVEHGADIEEIAEYAIDGDIKSALKEYGELEEEPEEQDEYDENVDEMYF